MKRLLSVLLGLSLVLGGVAVANSSEEHKDTKKVTKGKKTMKEEKSSKEHKEKK